MEKSAKSMASAAISSAKTQSIITAGRASGKSEQDIVAEVLGTDKEILDLGKTIKIVNLLKEMGEVFNLEYLTQSGGKYNQAFTGYALILQHYPHASAALEFDGFYQKAETVADVWKFFLKCNSIHPSEIEDIPGYTEDYFSELLNTPILETMGFSVTKKEIK